MFKKPTDREFTHDVPVLVPADDGHEEHKLRTRFRAKTRAQQAAFDLTTEESVDAWLREIVVAFEDVVDDAGEPVPMSDALLEEFIGTPCIRWALLTYYPETLAKTRLGN